MIYSCRKCKLSVLYNFMKMWVRAHQKGLRWSGLATGLLLIAAWPRLIETILILLFAGGVPGTQYYIPAAVMMAFWTIVGITFMVWVLERATTIPRTAPTSGKAFYHQSQSSTPVRGRKKTAERAVRRRYKKLES